MKLATGRPSLLTDQKKAQIKKYVIDNVAKKQEGRLMGKDIQKHIEEKFSVTYKLMLRSLQVEWCLQRNLKTATY